MRERLLRVAVVFVGIIIIIFFILCRRLRLPLRLLPRLAPVAGGHHQLPTDQKSLSRGILDVFSSCPNGTLRPRGKRRTWRRVSSLRQKATRKLQESYRQAYIYFAINGGEIARYSKQVV